MSAGTMLLSISFVLSLAKIQDGVLAVRSDDRNAVKVKIPNLIMLNKGEPLVPPVGDTKKNDRGYAHPMIAALLCPVKYEAKTEYVFIQ